MALKDYFAKDSFSSNAQDVFADRLDEREAFDKSLLHYYSSISKLQHGLWDAQDTDLERTNILSFYGIGGVGKSTLLNRLKKIIEQGGRPLHWPPFEHDFSKLINVHVDLGKGTSSSVETLLITIRAILMENGIRTTAFDLFLSAYWSQVYPNQSLNDRISPKSKLGALTNKVGLEQHVQDVIGDVAGSLLSVSTIGTSTYTLIKQIVASSRLRQQNSNALKNCKLLQEIIYDVRDPDAVSFSASLLAWDIQQHQKKSHLGILIFLDTLEELAGEEQKELAKVIFLLPNFLFITAGRNRIDWNNEFLSELPRVNKLDSAWPRLDAKAVKEPRQHLVGYLSEEDSRKYLWSKLPEADSELVQQIKSSSHGLPLHLDLSVQRFYQIAQSRIPVADDFKLSFDDLAKRVIRDLHDKEQLALLSCCLFDCFDEILIQRTAGLDRAGPVRELFKRSLLESNAQGIYGYSLHNVLRRALLTTEQLGMNQLSVEDWKLFSQRGAIELHSRLSDATSDESRFILAQLAGLLIAFNVGREEFLDALNVVFKNDNWGQDFKVSKLPKLINVRLDPTKVNHSLVMAAEIILTRQTNPREKVAMRLESILSHHTDLQEFEFVKYFLGEAYRDIGKINESDALFGELIKGSTVWSDRALHGQIHIFKRKGKFKTIEQTLGNNITKLKRHRRLQGDLAWVNCEMGKANTFYVEEARQKHNVENSTERAMCWAFSAFANSWLNQDQVASSKQLAVNSLGEEEHTFTELLILLAELISSDNFDLSLQIYNIVTSKSAEKNITSIQAYSELALGFIGAVYSRSDVVDQALDSISKLTVNGQFVFIEEILSQWGGTEYQPMKSETSIEWLDQNALERWKQMPVLRAEKNKFNGKL